MDSIEFLALLLVFAGVLAWYLYNLRAGAGGHAGLLALKEDPVAAKPKSKHANYSIRERTDKKNAGGDNQGAANAVEETFQQQAPSRQARARYRSREKAAFTKQQKGRAFR